MTYTTYQLHRNQREILDEANKAPVFIRRRGERYVITKVESVGNYIETDQSQDPLEGL